MRFAQLNQDEQALARKLAKAFCQTLQDGYIRDSRGPTPEVFHDACADLVRRTWRPKQRPITFLEKPSWSLAPSWAQWLAFEANGHWLWFSSKPTAQGQKWTKPERSAGGMHLYIDAWEDERLCRHSWMHFMEPRPVK